ncbi:MAG: metal-dependent transcriptional regulator [Chloroflexi bacterium]|nr:metal-dependent transcriptional regulator [Chloroflexota bacterium]MCY3957593.1 metal-dependent transcriptional regulator [Chloroflexota bacterium]
MPAPRISASEQDYLRAIYDAGGHERRVGTGELAGQLKLTQGAVTVALQRLQQKGLVDYQRYQGAQLTDEGERHALEMVRHHRLIERFLVEFLDYDWNDVHEEADRLEHVISEEMERRIAAKVSDPTTDPHGDSIPNEALDALQADDARQLTGVADGTDFVVARVRDRDRAVLEYLTEIQLVPGRQASVVRRLPFDGPLVVRIGTDEVAIGQTVSDSVFVRDA